MAKTIINPTELSHIRNVVSAAYTYYRIPWMTISGLANSFKVSKNTINKWLVEAVENGYVTEISICRSISKKHIEEYERSIGISESCLRDHYNFAFSNRSYPDAELLAVI